MAIPAGVSTALVTVGVPVTFTGTQLRSYVTITPSVSLVHIATGTPLVNMLEALDTDAGVAGQFNLPHTDQDGFQDENGNLYKNWFYTATIQYQSSTATLPSKTKVFQLPVGQSVVDLDRIAGGSPALPYSAPVATVTSVAGKTGAVTAVEIVEDPAAVTSLSSTYVASTLDGQDSITSQRALPLLQWIGAASNRDNARATVLMLGDSITEGSYITAMNNVWGHRLSATLRQGLPLKSGSVRGGVGYLLPFQSTNVPFTSPLAFTGAGTIPSATGFWGLGQRGAILGTTTQSVTATLPAPSTSIDIEWAAGNGPTDTLSVSVDGGAATTYTGLAATTVTNQRITFSARGMHTVVISASAGTVILNGVRVYDGDENSGIHVLVAGKAGAATSQFTGSSADQTAALNQSYKVINPDLVVIELGVNDYFQSVPVATYQANLSQLMANIKGVAPKACFLVVAAPKPYMAAPPAPWSNYLAAMKNAVTARKDAAFVDLGRRIYPANSGDPQGIYYDTSIHPNDKGSALYAQIVGKALTDGLLGGVATYSQSSTWQAPTLLNSWVNYGAPFAASGYRLDANGIVELQGVIRAGVATANTILFVLPVGYRPISGKVYPTVSNDAFAQVRVSAAGEVTINGGSNIWLSLDGIRFLAEA